MTYYGYIDESGTRPEHKVMTVSLVLFNGRKAAERARIRILRELHPSLKANLKVLIKKKLHFVDMQDSAKIQVAKCLVNENIHSVINSHFHLLESEPHDDIFDRYTRMVQSLVYRALDITEGPMNLIAAQQGGFDTYEKDFLHKIDDVVELYSRRKKGIQRTVKRKLRPMGGECGLQIADFYAGTVRKMLLDQIDGIEPSNSAPYDLVQHQISLEDFIDI